TERICALQVPLYYYVKTEGSLVSQSMNIGKVVRMKLMVFEYYNEFYKNVYEEEDYQKKKLQVYRFLIDAAGDSLVAPPLVPGVRKLGSERIPINRKAVDTDSVFMDFYRNRKLMDRYLEVVALEHDLTMNEVRLLFYLSQPHSSANRRELADFANMSYSAIFATLPLLAVKGLIRISDARTEDDGRKLDIQFTEDAAPILQDISVAVGDFEETQFAGFSQEEKIQYARLNQKIKENMVKILKPEVQV
ncbi:MAG: glycosyltransferase family 2 protein, partial [Lachnospiraceae bacterium]|nr:glycosyltransferase family 2 protein [Lachnospiraceae bacterium]